jgi:putative SOS response-associated peptidase YedK
MPVMLNTDAAKAWLMNELEVEQLQKEMISQKDLKHYAVSKLVGSVKNNSPELLIEDTPTTLF